MEMLSETKLHLKKSAIHTGTPKRCVGFLLAMNIFVIVLICLLMCSLYLISCFRFMTTWPKDMQSWRKQSYRVQFDVMALVKSYIFHTKSFILRFKSKRN